MRSSSVTATLGQGHLVLGVRRHGELLAQGHSRRGGVDQEEIDGLVRLAGTGQHDQPIGGRGVGHVALEPVETETRPARRRPRLDPAGREAVLGLQPGRREDRLAGGHGAQPLVLLRRAPRRSQHAPAHDGADEVRDRSEGPSQLLVEGHALDQRHARSAVLLGQEEADEVERSELGPQLGRVPDGVVLHGPDDVERAMARQHVACGLAQQLLLLVELKVQHVSTTFVIAEKYRARS